MREKYYFALNTMFDFTENSNNFLKVKLNDFSKSFNETNSFSKIKNISLSVMFLILFVGQVTAQQQYIGNAFTSAAVAPGAPAGSYSISNIENVSLSNGNLNIGLPLLQIGGRGTAGYTMMLPIEYKWTLQHLYYPTGGGQDAPWVHHYFPNDNWGGNSPDFIKYSPGAMRMQRASDVTGDCLTSGQGVSGKVLSRITFSGPDGTQLEFYDDRTKGKPAYFDGCFDLPDAAFRGNVWVTNSSGVTFIADSVYTEIVARGDDLERFPSGVMLFPGGNRYRIDLGKVSYIVDRNGNKLDF